jgi:DNA-binding NarL/FixJ family response regulator
MIQQNRQDKTDKNKVRIVIVDDHPIVRQGLENLINHEKDLMVCQQAENASQAMKAIDKLKPDIVIVDISLKEKNGLELIKDIKIQYPDLPILALSMHHESLYAERVIRAGARGYIMKQQATENIIKAIRNVLNGQIYVSDKMTAKMMHKLMGRRKDKAEASTTEILSDRELEVFLLIGKGHGTSQIADQLHLSVKTIESYRAHIKEKLALSNATELLQYAIQWANSKSE